MCFTFVQRGFNWEQAEKVARNFEYFIRGLGMYAIGKLYNENLEDTQREIGSDLRLGFWHDLLQNAV
jgi:hypothetical protein